MATFQQQSASPDGAASHPELSAPWLLTPNAASALAEPSVFDSWLDGGAGRVDLHGLYPPSQPAAYRSQDPPNHMGLVQQVHLLSAAEKASVLALLAPEEVGRE